MRIGPCSYLSTQTMCEQLNEPGRPVEVFAKFVKAFNNFTGETCVEANYTDSIQGLLPTSAGRSWTWQVCSRAFRSLWAEFRPVLLL